MTQDYLTDNYPISLKFKIGTLHNDFTATDANGEVLAYAKQKLFKLKEHVQIFANSNQSELKYEIRADKWLDFNTCYTFATSNGEELGKVTRKGWRSFWGVKYEILDNNRNADFTITEKNKWTKVFDSMFSEIPVLGIFTGYVFNPTYNIKRPDGTIICTLKKEPSFFGRTFTINKETEFEIGEEERILLSTMMMVLLERRRG